MDLFSDLPPPSTNSSTGTLFDDLPAVKKDLARPTNHERQDSDNEHPPTKKVKIDHYQVTGYLGERRGEREDMQDAHVIINDMTPHFSTLPNKISRVAYYGIFDGHSGQRAAKYAADNLHKILIEKFPKGDHSDREIKRCLVDTFKQTDNDFLSLASKATPTWKDGSTAVVILIVNNTIYSGNLGDSKAILCRRNESQEICCVPLTKDHTPANLEERKRIEKAGGTVREGRVMGILEVSRSIGDGRFKGCGLTSTPDVFRCQMNDNDLFILSACDGLWNVFNKEEAAEFVLHIVEDKSIQQNKDDIVQTNYESLKSAKSDRSYRFEVACNKLAVEAVKRGCTDNVTVMAIDILKPDP